MKICILTFCICIFFAAHCTAQPTFKITEGIVQFIHPEKGIVVKNSNGYAILSVYPEIEGGEIMISTKLNNIDRQDFDILKADAGTIVSGDITRYNFKKLKDIKFVSNEKDGYGEYECFLFNDEIFTQFQYEAGKLIELDEYYNYCYLEFTPNKKIVILFDGYPNFIVPTNNGVKLINTFNRSVDVVKNDHEYSREHYRHFLAAGHSDAYRIDTLANKKVRLVNYFGKDVIPETFDSINRGYFVIGYNSKKIELYNYRFKKLKLRGIRAVKVNEVLPQAQILQGNNIKTIGVTGKEATSEDNHIMPFIYEGNGTAEYFKEITLQKKPDGSFTLSEYENKVFDLADTKNIEALYFSNDTISKLLITHSDRPLNLDMAPLHDVIVYYKNKDKTFGINYLTAFIKERPGYVAQYKLDFSGYQNLDAIKVIHPEKNIYLFKKDNMYLLYPVNKTFKYKLIGTFEGFYARYELPDGKKGCLDLKGHEYPDM